MLNILQALLESHRYLDHKKTLGMMESSPYPNSTINAFWLDNIKKNFCCKDLHLGNLLRSCDGMILIKSKNEIHLFELKLRTPGMDSRTFFSNHLRPKNIPSQMIDSICVLLSIIGYYGIDKSFYSYFLDTKKLRIIPHLISDYTFEDLAFYPLAFQNEFYFSSTNLISDTISITTCDTLSKILEGEDVYPK